MRKVVVVALVGLCLPLVLPDRPAFADVTADLSQAEGLYKAGQYAQAEQPYLKVIREADANKPAESEAAFAAAKGLSLVYIATDQLPKAEEAVQRLLAKPTPHALHEIVDEAKTLNKLPQARRVYQEMIAAKGNDPQVIWLKTGLGITNVHLADDKAVEATLQDIIANHGKDDRAVEAFGQIAWAYRKLQQYDKALKVNQYTVDNWPEKPRAAYAQQGILVCQLALKKYEAADQALDVLVQKFGKDPEASKIVLWSGFAYQDANRPEEAYKVYGVVVQNYPESPEALIAQVRRAAASVEAEDPNRMEQDIQTLLKQFAPSRDKGVSVRSVADVLFWRRFGYRNQPAKLEIVAVIDRYLQLTAEHTLANWPKSDWALWAERDLATAAIQRADDAAAQAAVDRLTADYVDRADALAALTFLADQSFDLKTFGLADHVYEFICDRWPKERQGVLAKVGRAKVRVALGRQEEAEAIFEKLLADNSTHPSLVEAVRLMGEGYWELVTRASKTESVSPRTRDVAQPPNAARIAASRRYYTKALENFDMVIRGFPEDAINTPIAYHMAGECYIILGQPRKAAEYYRKVCETWPAYRFAGHLHFMLGRLYEQLAVSGAMSKSEAATLTKAAYERLLERYPKDPAAKAARSWLTSNSPRWR